MSQKRTPIRPTSRMLKIKSKIEGKIESKIETCRDRLMRSIRKEEQTQ